MPDGREKQIEVPEMRLRISVRENVALSMWYDADDMEYTTYHELPGCHVIHVSVAAQDSRIRIIGTTKHMIADSYQLGVEMHEVAVETEEPVVIEVHSCNLRQFYVFDPVSAEFVVKQNILDALKVLRALGGSAGKWIDEDIQESLGGM